MIYRKNSELINLLFIILIFSCAYPLNEKQQHEINRKDFNWNADVLDAALQAELVQWKNDPNVNTEYTAYDVLHTGKALNYLALVAFHDRSDNYPDVSSKIIEQLQHVISGANEPCCRGTIAGWADNSLAQTIALAKHTESVWEKLSKAEKERLDLLMKAMAIAGNYCQNSRNRIHKCLYQSFEWRKSWNPNHQEGYVGVMIAAWIYFGGADEVNAVLTSFDYDNYMEKFQMYGFNNVKTCWQTTGKELMENGGKDTGGGLTYGVKIPFRYTSLSGYGELEYDPYLLYRDLADRMYKHTVTSEGCDGKAFIVDGSHSPYEGQKGMCYEFDGVDASGCRSSARYCYDGWCNNILTAASLESFGLWRTKSDKEKIIAKLNVGSSDLLYKLKHGYRDHKHGKTSDVFAKDLKGIGYIFIKDIYENIFMK